MTLRTTVLVALFVGGCAGKQAPVVAAPDPAGAEQRCQAGSAEACASAAEAYLHRQDVKRAADYLERACSGGHQGSCASLSVIVATGKAGITRDPARAVALARGACEARSRRGCHNLASLYLMGLGVPRDISKARELFVAACEAKYIDSCNSAGGAYLADPGSDPARARHFLERACTAGMQNACVGLGTLYRDGRGMAADAERARGYFRGACEKMKGAGCYHLARMEKDPAAAQRGMERGCDLGEGRACFEVGRRLAKNKADLALAEKKFKEACAGGVGLACLSLGVLGMGYPQLAADPASGVEHFRKECQENASPHACTLFAVAKIASDDREEARQEALRLLDQTCRAQNRTACEFLMLAYTRGILPPPALDVVADTAKRACALGAFQYCSRQK